MSDPNSSVVEVVGQFLLDMVDSKQKSNKLPRLADDSDVEVISEVNKNERLSPLRESSKIVECSVDNAQDVEVLEYSKGEISHEHDKSEEQDEIEVLFERVKSTDKSTEFISLGEESHGFGRKRKRRKKKILGKLPSKNDDSAQLRYFSADSQGGTNGSNIVANLAFKTKKQKAKYQKSLKAAAIRMCLNAAHSQVNFPKGTEKFNGKATSIPALSSDKINLAVKVPVRNEPRIVTIGKKKSKRNKSIVESRETDYIPLPITHSQSPTCSGQNSCTSGPALLNTIIARKLRPIVIDGPNVAMNHGQSKFFSCRAIWLCAEHWLKLGHQIHVVMPAKISSHATSKKAPVTEAHLIDDLEQRNLIIRAPARRVLMAGGAFKNIHPYDDRLIVQIAHICGGVIISNDHYKDIMLEHPEWRDTLEKRVLMYTWLSDVIIFPTDPLGRHGPHLEEVIRFPPGTDAPSLVCTTVPQMPSHLGSPFSAFNS